MIRPDTITSEEKIIEGVLRNKRRDQELFFKNYSTHVYKILLRYTNNSHDAEDLLMEVFDVIFQKISTYDSDKGSIKSWISTIAIRRAINFLKKRSKYSASELSEGLFIQSDTQPHQLFEKDILTIISTLREPYRTIFNLRIDGYQYEEIAHQLNIEPVTARSYYKRSREMLSQIIEKIGANHV